LAKVAPSWIPGVLNHAAAEADIAIVKHHRLTRCNGPLRLIENDFIATGFAQYYSAVLIRLAVTCLGHAAEWQGRCRGDPVDVAGVQAPGKQPGMIGALAHDQFVGFQILAQHIPGGFAFVGNTADADALALTDGVIHQPLVVPQHLAVIGNDLAWAGGQILLQKIAEAPFTDKADPGTVFLVVIVEALLPGDLPNLRLFHRAQREQGARNLASTYRMQEVALVLVGIQPFQQGSGSLSVDRQLL